MLSFVILALVFVGSQQVTAKPEPEPEPNLGGTFLPDVPNPTVMPDYYPGYNPNPDFIPGMPNPFSCPTFPIIPFHYLCYCDLSYCLDPYIEAEAEILAQNTRYISLCSIQQMFLLVESVCPGLDPATEVTIVSMIIYALEAEIYNGGYIPSMPEYCNQYSNLDPFSPSSMFSSDYSMSYYNARMQFMLDKTMPRLSEQLEITIRQIIEVYLQGQYEFDEAEMYFKLCFCLRGILSNMIDTNPYVY